MGIVLRAYAPADAAAVNAIAVTAFSQYRDHYADWPAVAVGIGKMSALAETGDIIVAEHESAVVGAVAYLGPQAHKADFFKPIGP